MTDPEHTNPDDALDEIDAEPLEDLDVDDDAEDVEGGTTWNCGPMR